MRTPPRSTLTDTLFPSTALSRSLSAADGRASGRHRDLAGRAGQGVEEAGNREPGPRRRPTVTRAMPLSRLLPDVAAVPPELAITGLVLDSRSIEPGEAFVAIGGFGTHGLHFVEQARAEIGRAPV